MDRATWAIIISTTSALVSIVGIIWQLALYRLSGARVALTMRPALIDSLGTIRRGPEKGWKEASHPFGGSQWTIEVVEITVTNVGRAAISISEVSVDFGRLHRWRPSRHTISGIPIDAHGAIADETFRLDTGESSKIIFDFWALVQVARKYREENGFPLDLTVRASALPAGRRPRRSPWGKRWRVESQRQALYAGQNIDAELGAYRAFWRSFRLTGERDRASLIWELIFPLIRDNKTPTEINEYLREELNASHAAAVLSAYNAYNASSAGSN